MFRNDGFCSTPVRARRDGHGTRWNFSYWHMSIFAPIRGQRLFFWDDERRETGVVIFTDGGRGYREIAKLAEKLTRDAGLRRIYLRELRFPLDRHYAALGSFPEEDARRPHSGLDARPESASAASKKTDSM